MTNIDLVQMTKQILGIEDLDKKKIQYVLISQSHPRVMDMHVSEIPDEFFISEYKKPSWGYGLFVVKEDGYLKIIESNFDTSD